MEEIIDCLNTAEAKCFNRARKHQEALTFSDNFTPNGNSIDPSYLQDWTYSFEGTLGKHWSLHNFGVKHPSKDDWATWESTLRQYCMGCLKLPNSLGAGVANAHCV